jgi:hypothetical protein
MIGVVAVLVITLVLIAALLISGTKDDTTGQVRAGAQGGSGGSAKKSGAAGGGRKTTTTTTSTTTTVPTTLPTTSTSVLPGDVRLEPPGLTCAALVGKSYPYDAAVAYWQLQGSPARMDVDGNGRPCETVYSPQAVQAFWQARP